jgi:hypothetical protein
MQFTIDGVRSLAGAPEKFVCSEAITWGVI